MKGGAADPAGRAGQEPSSELVFVVDFGAQYSQLIARRVREHHVYCELVPHSTPLDGLLARRPRAIILSGGPASVYAPGAPRYDERLFDAGVPVLGICYGMQLMAYLLRGRVERGDRREYGRAILTVMDDTDLFHGIEAETHCWMSHGDLVLEPPPGFATLARTENSPVAAFADRRRRLYGVQFHPEVVHTHRGRDIMGNFLYRVAGCHGLWTPEAVVEAGVREVAEKVGEDRAIVGLSGGVDSAVAAAIAHRALGDRLLAVFVDHGLLRKGEPETIIETFGRRLGSSFIPVRAADRFLARLTGVRDPERKRKIIGEEFIRVFEEEAARLGVAEDGVLIQGTVYPDVIESGGGAGVAAVIKSHHNVGGLPERMSLRVVEPLRSLFKDEVRAAGEELGLPAEIVWRPPFPGPGLAIRIIGPVTRRKLAVLREADFIVRDEIERAGLGRDLWQYFAVLPGVRSVGVMGDERTYAYTVAVRAVTSDDAMTADWARLPHDLLERIASRMVSEIPQVNRVVYDVTSKPPATIEWE
jgi:GMP synthase (glutamine-hydrolysing)